MKIYLVTKNHGKIAAARHAFAGNNIELVSVEKDYPEIQADTSLEIARFTAQEAAHELGAPALREDHSFCLNALKGIPGPYMNYFNRRLSENDIIDLYKQFAERSGYFEVATVLAHPDGALLESLFRVSFTLSFEPRGMFQTGWNRIIILKGETRTLAEYPEHERVHIWNKGYQDILAQLKIKG